MSDVEKKARAAAMRWSCIPNEIAGAEAKAIYDAYFAGAAEALRWRDPKVETPPPKFAVLVYVIGSTVELGYLSDGKWFDGGDDEFMCHLGGALWRPIGPLPTEGKS